jgi:hypothetical protein
MFQACSSSRAHFGQQCRRRSSCAPISGCAKVPGCEDAALGGAGVGRCGGLQVRASRSRDCGFGFGFARVAEVCCGGCGARAHRSRRASSRSRCRPESCSSFVAPKGVVTSRASPQKRRRCATSGKTASGTSAGCCFLAEPNPSWKSLRLSAWAIATSDSHSPNWSTLP